MPSNPDHERTRPVARELARVLRHHMSLVEILPEVHALPRADKLRLIQLLAQAEAAPALVAGQTYAVWSPAEAFTAAETLLQSLRAE